MEDRESEDLGQSKSLMQQNTAVAQADQARAIQEVQAALIIAKKFPRDEIESEKKVMQACQRYSLAEQASYAFPRGKEVVSGPSIRLAETLARCWGNLQYGFRELEQEKGGSMVEAFCHDLETNTRVTRVFKVHHKIGLKGGATKILTDERDIYEKVANNAQRRVRAAILEIIPGDIVEKAEKTCEKTLQAGQKSEPMIDRITRMVLAFEDLGVKRDQIEKRLGHSVEQITLVQIGELQKIFNSLREGMSKREDWFAFGSTPQAEGAAAEINAKFGVKKEEPKPAEPGSFESFNQAVAEG